MPQRTIPFTKMHGAGNDYIYVNTILYPIQHPELLASVWSDRHKGIGGDGLILIGSSSVADFSMRMFNNDGSEGKMCGNGSRCVAKYVYDRGLTSQKVISLETLSGIKQLHMETDEQGKVSRVRVDMDKPLLTNPQQLTLSGGNLIDGIVTVDGFIYTGTFVCMGNPHFIVFVDNVELFDVTEHGRRLECASVFPERCNIEFATIKEDGNIRMRVWERGSGITMACGTGACATAVAAFVTKRAGRASNILMDGGAVHVVWDAGDSHVYMTGSATHVFDGVVSYDEDELLRAAKKR